MEPLPKPQKLSVGGTWSAENAVNTGSYVVDATWNPDAIDKKSNPNKGRRKLTTATARPTPTASRRTTSKPVTFAQIPGSVKSKVSASDDFLAYQEQKRKFLVKSRLEEEGRAPPPDPPNPSQYSTSLPTSTRGSTTPKPKRQVYSGDNRRLMHPSSRAPKIKPDVVPIQNTELIKMITKKQEEILRAAKAVSYQYTTTIQPLLGTSSTAR